MVSQRELDHRLIDRINREAEDRPERTRRVLQNVALAAAGILTAAAVTLAAQTDTKAETLEPIGRFKLTWYCPCRTCSGEWGHQTSSGATCVEGVTAATDYFRPGTRIYIEGFGERIVQDTGVHGRWIDIFMEDHDECNENGIQYRQIYVIRE